MKDKTSATDKVFLKIFKKAKTSLKKRLIYIFLIITPKNRLGDKLISFLSFILIHKRLPTKKPIYNDALYRIKTTNEILDPIRVFVSDKEFVKIFIKATVGNKYNVPNIAILRNTNEIDEFNFPKNCCIKPTHGSGMFILRKNDEPVDKSKIKNWLKVNYYKKTREANYRYLVPKIIVEPLVFDGINLKELKLYCYNGKVKLILLDFGKSIDRKRLIIDKYWNLLETFAMGYSRPNEFVTKPKNYSEIINVTEKLAEYFNFIRIDIYFNENQFFVGEITNCSSNVNRVFEPISGELDASRIIFD